MTSSENGVRLLLDTDDIEEEDNSEFFNGVQGLQETMATAGEQSQRPQKELRTKFSNGDATRTASSDTVCSSLLWENGGRSPDAMRRGSAAVVGDTVYFNSNNSHEVYGYRDIATVTTGPRGQQERRGKWFRVVDYPVKHFTLAVVGQRVTGVGGVSEGLITDTCSARLLCLGGEGKTGRWVEELPPMPTPRGFVGVVAMETHLVVAGGGSMEVKVQVVEVFDIATRQWSSAHQLPRPLTSISMVILQGEVYLGGFFCQRVGHSVMASQSVLACPLHSLLPRKSVGVACDDDDDNKLGGASSEDSLGGVASGEAAKPYSGKVSLSDGGVGSESMKGFSFSRHGERSVASVGWRNVRELPVACSTLVAIGNRLLAVGGVLLSGPYSSQVYGFDSRSNTWSVMGRLGVQRSLPLVAVVPGNRLVVVGGLMPNYSWGGTDRCDHVELFTAVY